MKKKNAFTLIELIAVLVILAVIALVVTPLVLNIVKKAKDSANKRSVDAYGKAVELAVATYLLDTGDYPTTLDNLIVEYTGNEVVCNVKTLNEDGSIYLSECTVKGTEVKDSKMEDGWYHFGKTTNNVVTYDAYNIGDTVTYNGMDFYVIANSDENSDSVTLLKAEPLTVDEVNTYGAGHVNMYVLTGPHVIYYQRAAEKNGYGAMAYYSSPTCGFYESNWVSDGCTNDYNQSEVKYVVDAWAIDKFATNDLKEDSLGYKARLITIDELQKHSEKKQVCTGNCFDRMVLIYEWLYNSDYTYKTMSPYEDSVSAVWYVDLNGSLGDSDIYYEIVHTNYTVVRPVVTLLKSAITK